jgi:glutamate-1-semialdehyde 2,1-aminomutase
MIRSGRPCRACGQHALSRVLDLGTVPAADHFPAAELPVQSAESSHPLAMDLCGDCGLAQLADDDTVTSEPRGVEPEALQKQARDAVARVAASGWLTGETVREFGSPHGGSWLKLLEQCDVTEESGAGASDAVADIVLDCFGIMHEPDQRAAFAERAAATAPGGVLLLQYHALGAIVEHGQWNALRHGHFAYYSLPALVRLLADAGMRAVSAWDFALYGGTTLVAAVHEHESHQADSVIQHMCASEQALTVPSSFSSLQSAADRHAVALRTYLEHQRSGGRRVFAYGAASRAVALFARAGLHSGLIAAVADASPAKQGRRMPGTDIAIISPDALITAAPDEVLLTLADLLPEVSTRLPELAGRWVTDDWIGMQSG